MLMAMQTLILPSVFLSYFLCKPKDMLFESYDLSLSAVVVLESLIEC